MLLKPDPTFYASAKDAMKAPPETLAYVALLSATGNGVPDALGVVGTDASTPEYARELGRVELPKSADELHHFGGTRAVPRSVRLRRDRTSNGVISSCRACARRASTSSTRSLTPRSQRSYVCSSPTK